MAKKTPYQDLSDIEKLQKQWHKLSGLHTREEWSAAVVRAATAAEIAANFAIRAEFARRSKFSAAFVDGMLRWANGISGKIDRLLVPLVEGDEGKQKKLKSLKSLAERINKKRNSIAHQGEFCKEKEAIAIIADAKEFITELMGIYKPAFKLKERRS